MAERTPYPMSVWAIGGAEQVGWLVHDFEVGIDGHMSSAVVEIPDEIVQNWDTFDADNQYAIKINSTIMFKGRPLAPVAEWGRRNEAVLATLYGMEWELDRRFLWGQYVTTRAGPAAWVTGLPCVFNPEGNKNKDASNRRFQPDPGASPVHWTAKDVVEFLIERFDDLVPDIVDAASISWPTGFDQIEVYNLNVQGMTYREALTEVVNRCGYSWYLTPKTSDDTECDFKLVKRGDSTGATTEQLYLPAVDANLSAISAADLKRSVPEGNAQFDHTECATTVIGYGGVMVYEKSWQLLKGWSASDEAAAFGGATTPEKIGFFFRVSRKDFSGFDTFRNVGRRYILNETGREDTNPLSAAYDFDLIFATTDYAKRARPFLPYRVQKDANGNTMPPIVRVDGRVYGADVSDTPDGEYTWRLLQDIAGIYFDSDHFPYDDTAALIADDYEAGFPETVTIVAALESDSAVSASKNGTSPAFSVTVQRVIDLSARFGWNNKTGSTTKLESYVQQRADQIAKRQDVARMLIHEINTDYEPGVYITAIQGRSITFDGMIVSIRYDNLNQTTALITESLRADIELPERDEEPRSKEPPPSAVAHEGMRPTTRQLWEQEEYYRKRGLR